MSCLVIGDLHLKQKAILPYIEAFCQSRKDITRIVMLGDACDDWGANEWHELKGMNFYADWVEAQRLTGLQIDVLIGNHDFCYLRGTYGPGTVMTLFKELRDILENRLQVTFATTIGPYLCLHGGLTHMWAKRYIDAENLKEATPKTLANQLNTMWENPRQWEALDSCPPSRGGWGLPGPIWADLIDLTADAFPGINQIVGHTPTKTIAKFSPNCVGNNAVLFACDTMSLTSKGQPIGDGSLLLVQDNNEAEIIPFPKADFKKLCQEYWNAKLL